MIQLIITKTGKSFNPKDEYKIFDTEEKTFADLPSAKQFLNETYGKSKRRPMFCDTKEGKPKHIGYVIGFKNADLSHSPVEKWLQQDWIHFNEVKSLDLDAE